ncbi:unnamed protein product [Cuscuta campestris]|uniref:Ubiquitin-like protease family profile domain-containing protein n=1 Tax=Cuscuta campestris TaxID=132261 RepID=A0A484LY05_9ASTE|nr:unnamed protein product [Cuscuta campestris]
MFMTQDDLEQFRNSVLNDAFTMYAQRLPQLLQSLGAQVLGSIENIANISQQLPMSTPQFQQSSKASVDPDPFANLTEMSRCHMSITDPIDAIVARGSVFPCSPRVSLHNAPLPYDHVKVSVDVVLDGMGDYPIPTPTDEHTTVSSTLGSMCAWPKALVHLGDPPLGSPVLPTLRGMGSSTKGFSRVSAYSEDSPHLSHHSSQQLDSHHSFSQHSSQQPHTHTEPPFQRAVEPGLYATLGPSCRDLCHWLTQMEDLTNIEILIEPWALGYAEERVFNINPENIKEFLRWEMIDNSIVEIFMRHLYGYMRTHDIRNVGLVCPDDLQHMVKNGNRKPVERMLLDHKEKSWVLLPFFCERTHHYTLIVIRYYENKVYYFNSALRTGTSKNLTLKSYVNESWRILRVQGMGFLKMKPTWTDVGIVPQQPGGTKCGYYVMRFMWLIISLCAREFVPIETVFNSFDPYTIEQLDELREMWANTFLDELVS